MASHGRDWYLANDSLDTQRVIDGWLAKHDDALAQGFAGIRVAGNALWCENDRWREFRDYEAALDRSLDGYQIIALCTYSLTASRAIDLLDVARCHHCSIARRAGRWQLLETPQLSQAAGSPTALDKLTPREHAVLAQIVKGDTTKEAARALGISPRTLEFHRANMMRKLGARNVADLIGKAVRPGDR